MILRDEISAAKRVLDSILPIYGPGWRIGNDGFPPGTVRLEHAESGFHHVIEAQKLTGMPMESCIDAAIAEINLAEQRRKSFPPNSHRPSGATLHISE
ncbi:MAG: hypothetical protein QNJ44_08865 [Rhodobacter sp.]|nr:hypothetical protein [Rhodobacter sp.]